MRHLRIVVSSALLFVAACGSQKNGIQTLSMNDGTYTVTAATADNLRFLSVVAANGKELATFEWWSDEGRNPYHVRSGGEVFDLPLSASPTLHTVAMTSLLLAKRKAAVESGSAAYDDQGCNFNQFNSCGFAAKGVCCDQHDRCFWDYGCTVTSVNPSCLYCDVQVAACYTDPFVWGDSVCCAGGTCGKPWGPNGPPPIYVTGPPPSFFQPSPAFYCNCTAMGVEGSRGIPDVAYVICTDSRSGAPC